MLEPNNVKQESLPEEAVNQPDSADDKENVQEQENPTPQTGEAQEPKAQEEQAIPYSRFKEVNDEKNWYKQQIETLVQQQRVQQPTQPIQQQEIELGNTPEEREFWRMQRRIAREEAEKVAAVKEQIFQSQLESVRAQQASQMEQEFRSKHPDIKRGSSEELEISNKINIGYLPDDAYWAVMGARGLVQAQSQAVKKVQQNIIQKKQANIENSPGVSQQIKSTPPKSIDEVFAENWVKMECGEL